MLTHILRSNPLGETRPASSPRINSHNGRRPALALVKDGADTLMLRTLLQDRGFVVVTVDWQQRARGGMNAWSAPSCRDVPAAPGAPKLQEVNHPTGVPTLAGVPNRPGRRSW